MNAGPIGLMTRMTAPAGGRDRLVEALGPFLRLLEDDRDVEFCGLHLDDAGSDSVWLYTLFPDAEARARHQQREAAMTQEMAGLLAALDGAVTNITGSIAWRTEEVGE